MRTLVDQLSQYADYHRDRRNIATHFVGIPAIAFAVAVLLSRPVLATVAGVAVTPAALVALACTVWYLRLDLRYGIAMGVLLALAVAEGTVVAAGSTTAWLAIGVGVFVGGWILQFIGHAFEGRKPAFVDDLVGLVVGPLFVVAEAGFLMGLRRDVQAQVEARSGPTRVGRTAASAS